MAGDAGRLERPTGSRSPVPSRARSVITRCTSTGCTSPTGPPGQQPQRGVRGDRPTPAPCGASSGHCPATTARERACSAACAPTTSSQWAQHRSGTPSRPAPGAPSPAASCSPRPPSGPPPTPRPARPRPAPPPARHPHPQPAQHRTDPAGPPRPGPPRTSTRWPPPPPPRAAPRPPRRTARPSCRRHLVHQRPGHPHEPVPHSRRLPPRQRHLRPHRPRHVPRRALLPRAPQRVRGPRLRRRRGALDPLQLGDQAHPLPVTQPRHVHRGQPRPERRPPDPTAPDPARPAGIRTELWHTGIRVTDPPRQPPSPPP